MKPHYRTEAEWLADFAREQSQGRAIIFRTEDHTQGRDVRASLRLEYKRLGCAPPPLKLQYSKPIPIQVKR